MTSERLVRPLENRVIAGVCAGLAEHAGWPVVWVRAGAALLALASGFGVALYAWLWATTPSRAVFADPTPLKEHLTPAAAEPGPVADSAADVAPDSVPKVSGEAVRDPAPTRKPRALPIAELFLGGVLLLAGILLVLSTLGVAVPLHTVLPALAVIAGIGLTWWQIAQPGGSTGSQLVRTVGALVLVTLGVLMFFVTAREPNAGTVIAAALAVLAGVALAIAPWVIRINSELIAERTGRAREAERSEIAAHLHDSVLQTLALIQQQSPPDSEASRLARGQERELREWLFRTPSEQDKEARVTGEEALRQHAAELEASHAVRFELIAVGGPAPAPEPILLAAREAMLNAARHAGGTVTVYLETGQGRTDIDITDRGPGFDPNELPDDRMGVRGSIVGRMTRAGGTAHITPGPGGSGVSVRLSLANPTQAEPEEASR